MQALQTIEATIWKDTLINLVEDPEAVTPVYPIRELVPLVGVADEYKVYWEHVDDVNDLPYITTHHISGGRLKNPTYSDTIWKIVGHTADIETAEALANAISLLTTTDVNVEAFAGAICPYNWVEEIMPIFDRYQTQNVPQFVVGGLYRLRLNLGDF